MRWLRWKVRWWKWFLFEGPSTRVLYFGMARLDRSSRRILFERWLAQEPKR